MFQNKVNVNLDVKERMWRITPSHKMHTGEAAAGCECMDRKSHSSWLCFWAAPISQEEMVVSFHAYTKVKGGW